MKIGDTVMRFDKQFLMKALPKATLLYETFPHYPNISVDSRTLSENEIFVAIKGQRVDGHNFVLEAIEKGAAGIILEEAKANIVEKLDAQILKNKLVVVVKDSMRALTRLATAWREQFNCAVVGITGSVGKSSTKEILRNILNEGDIPSYVSYGNQNSLIGVPINLLKIRAKHKVAVFEMGIGARGEMVKLVNIVRPTIGVITSIGHSHMAGLGALADIAEEKRMIFKYFKADNIGIINGDVPLLSQIGYTHPVIKFGSKTTNQIQARKVRSSNGKTQFTLKIYQQKFADIKITSSHEGVVFNALGAVAVACLLEVPYDKIVKGIQKPINLPGRFEQKVITEGKGGTLIDDCYNASPESVKAALVGFDKMSGDYKKVVVLGDMNELGVDALFWHRQIGRLLAKVSSIDYILLVGGHVKEVQKTLPVTMKATVVEDWEDGLKYLRSLLKKERLAVLVKGSTVGYTEGLAKLVKEISSHAKDLKAARPLGKENYTTL